MKALVVAPQPFYSPRGTPLSVYHRTRVTADLGIEVDFLTYGEGQDVDLPGVRIFRIPRIRFLEPIKVGPSAAKAVLDVLMVAWTVTLLIRNRYAFVHAHEEAVFWCTFLKPIFRFKLVYDMHSSLPQQLTNFSFTRSRLLIGTFECLELAALRAADAVITISPALAEYAEAQLDEPDRHLLIENSLFDPVRVVRSDGASEKEVVVEPLAEGRPIVSYAGTFQSYQGIDLLLEAHRRVLDQRPDAFLLLIGGSAVEVVEYQAMADRLGIREQCLFTGSLPQSVTRELLESASLVTSPRTRGTNTPLKIYEQLSCGIPLVATRVPAHTQVLDESVCFFADPEPDSFARAVLEGLDDSARRSSVVSAARALYDRQYSPDSYRRKMRRLLELLA
ncbi:MAG TPA: glycosyltransferase family 4 protein [Longimicrobiales bacterium]|nr:glycosyltransferase family 4 protein [Longimicrobiales bacterium]